MPLKPNILDDIARDHWIAAPPPREKYLDPDGSDKVMLEDESGRLGLKGAILETEMLVTGAIVAVLGTESRDGEFEVISMKLPDLPGQPGRWEVDDRGGKALKQQMQEHKKRERESNGPGKLAIVSGLEIRGDYGDSLTLDILMEWLLGESTSPSLQAAAANISRLIVAGDSLSDASPIPSSEEHGNNLIQTTKKAGAAKKYGYDASSYNPAPTLHLDTFLSTLLPSLPVTILPGASDPANVSLPQQPLHPALFPQSRAYSVQPTESTPGTKTITANEPLKTKSLPTSAPYPLHAATNPALVTISGHLTLISSGQPVNDISKYLPFPDPTSGYMSPIDLLEATLRWRLVAPTAPDTLWCYPYQNGDPFVIDEGMCPKLYISGCAEKFETRVVEGANIPEEGKDVPWVRCISVPRFRKTGEVVLVDLETLEVEVVQITIHEGMNELNADEKG